MRTVTGVEALAARLGAITASVRRLIEQDPHLRVMSRCEPGICLWCHGAETRDRERHQAWRDLLLLVGL